MNADGYLAQFFKLLPPGRLFRRDPDSLLGRLLHAFGDGAAAFDAVLIRLAENADPRTAVEMLPAWERNLGLPEPGAPVPPDLAGRQAAVWQKYASTGGQSEPYFIEVADRLGYAITIDGFRPTTCGARCGARCHTTLWRFTWRVNVAAPGPAPVLEHVLNKLKPADSAVIFTYSE